MNGQAASKSGTVACIGAGNVGRAWAIVFARAAYNVILYDTNKDVLDNHTIPMIRQSVEDLESAGLVDDANAIISRINTADSIREAVSDSFYIQESVLEDLQVKRTVLCEIDQHMTADAVLASSTSAIPGSSFMDHLTARDRALVAHPVNPPYLIKLVEICRTPWTTDSTVNAVYNLMQEVGQSPICLSKEIDGFILNRLQFTLVGEALHLVSEGYCTAADIDRVVSEGLAPRWSFIGPFQVAHLNATTGFRGFIDGLGSMMRRIGRDAKPDYPWGDKIIDQIHAELSARIPVSDVPKAQSWRDNRLMEFSRYTQKANEKADN